MAIGWPTSSQAHCILPFNADVGHYQLIKNGQSWQGLHRFVHLIFQFGFPRPTFSLASLERHEWCCQLLRNKSKHLQKLHCICILSCRPTHFCFQQSVIGKLLSPGLCVQRIGETGWPWSHMITFNCCRFEMILLPWKNSLIGEVLGHVRPCWAVLWCVCVWFLCCL